MMQDVERFKMDPVSSLERTLHGKIKPSESSGSVIVHFISADSHRDIVITQCSMRHLYTLDASGSDVTPSTKANIIELAKTYERRRCNHHTLAEPLSTLACYKDVIDPKASNTNKNRYVVASQEEEVRKWCRAVRGVPMVYVKRSVMVMEPMAEGSVGVREGVERSKLRGGLLRRGRNGTVLGSKRQRDPIDDDHGRQGDEDGEMRVDEAKLEKRRVKGPRGPNPLSVKKPKKEKQSDKFAEDDIYVRVGLSEPDHAGFENPGSIHIIESGAAETGKAVVKSKRRRKHKTNPLQVFVDRVDESDATAN